MFIFLFITSSLFGIGLLSLDLQGAIDRSDIDLTPLYAFEVLFSLVIISYLMALLKRYHNYEYYFRRSQPLFLFLANQLTCIPALLSDVIAKLSLSNSDKSFDLRHSPYKYPIMVVQTIHVYGLSYLLSLYVLFYIKPTKDVLSGISKLEFILENSIFQRATISS